MYVYDRVRQTQTTGTNKYNDIDGFDVNERKLNCDLGLHGIANQTYATIERYTGYSVTKLIQTNAKAKNVLVTQLAISAIGYLASTSRFSP